jgi:acyl-CoA thioester hydrolase
MKAHASVRIDIPFHDVDAMRIVWHGNYARYFEIARTVLLRQYELDYPEMEASGWLFPVIRMDCRYLSPLRYGDIALVDVTVEEAEFKMVLSYRIVEEKTGKKIATGHTEHAVLDRDFNLRMPIPPALRERFVSGGAPSAPP